MSSNITLTDTSGDAISLTTSAPAPLVITDIFSAPIVVTALVNGKDGATDYNALTNKPLTQKITVASVAPSSPSVNDVWINTA